VSKKLVLTNPMDQFLTGAQRVTGLRDGCIFNSKFGADKIAKFKRDGKIPEIWVSLLADCAGGSDVLKRFYTDLAQYQKDMKVVSLAVENSKGSKNNRTKRIPVDQVHIVLGAIKIHAGLRSDVEIAGALEVEVADISYMRKGKTRIEKAQLRAIIKAYRIQEKVFEKWL